MSRPELIELWAAAMTAGEGRALGPLLAEDVVLVSPLTDAFRFRGRRQVAHVFEAAFDLVSGLRLRTITGDGDRVWAVVLDGMVRGAPMSEVQLLVLDVDGSVGEVTLFGRPVPALVALMEGIGPALRQRGEMSTPAALAARAVLPLRSLFTTLERHVLPRVPPRGD